MARLRTSRMQRKIEKIALLTFWANLKHRQTALTEDINYMNHYAGICDRAGQLGYEVEEFWAKEPGVTSSRLSKILYTRGIRGVILAPQYRSYGHASLDWRYFAAATVTYTVTKPEVHRVTHSHYNGMQILLRQLKRHTYRRPGFATLVDQNERVKRTWEGSFLANQSSLPAKSRIPPLLIPKFEAGPFRKWLEKYRPDVVISNLALPLQMLIDFGYSVPDDIGFATLDLALKPVPAQLSIAGIDQQPLVQGAATADLVIKQIQNNEFGLPESPVTLHFDGVWREGTTIRPLKA